jgi:hypothetical protein
MVRFSFVSDAADLLHYRRDLNRIEAHIQDVVEAVDYPPPCATTVATISGVARRSEGSIRTCKTVCHDLVNDAFTPFRRIGSSTESKGKKEREERK